MNKIIREHYAAADIPEDLQEGIDPQGRVTITIAEEGQMQRSQFSFRKIFDELHDDRVSSDDPVMRIRALREEWEDRGRFLDGIHRGGSD